MRLGPRRHPMIVLRPDPSRITLQEYDWDPQTGIGSFKYGRDNGQPVCACADPSACDHNADYAVTQRRYWVHPDKREAYYF